MKVYRLFMLLCLLGAGVSPVSADIVFDFKGNHPVYGKATASLHLKDNYIFGAAISAHDMIKLDVHAKRHYTIYPKETTSLYLAMNIDGSLANHSGNFQFYVDASQNRFFGTREDGTWRANDDLDEGNLGRWRLRAKGFDMVCLANDNFHKAAGRGDKAYVQQCLKSGSPVNRQEGNGWTALHSAASNGHVQVVRVLLQHGADPGIKDKSGRTASDQAKLRKQYDVVSVLGGGAN